MIDDRKPPSDSDWLDSWTRRRRLPSTFSAAHRYATREGHSADLIGENGRRKYPPMADTMRILRRASDLAELERIEWAWLRELVRDRVEQVGFGPWRDR